MRSMAASSDFDVIEREKEEKRKRENASEREGTGGHFVDNVFQRRLHGNVRRIDIRSTPRGGGRRPEGAGATRGAAVVRVKRDGTTGVAGYARRRTCVPDGASLFGDGDHYSIRFHFGFPRKTICDRSEWSGSLFFQRSGKVSIFSFSTRPCV